jgi:hypothetical protein
VDSDKLTVNIDQTQDIDELLTRLEMSDCNPVSIPMAQFLSSMDRGEKLSVKDHEVYRNMVGILLLYLACRTLPDIA